MSPLDVPLACGIWKQAYQLPALFLLVVAGISVQVDIRAAEVQEPGPPLEPAKRIDATAGAKWIGHMTGEKVTTSLDRVQGSRWFLSSDWGCSWERLDIPGWPGERWTGCHQPDGTLRVKLEGQVFPLKVGNRWTIELDPRAWT